MIDKCNELTTQKIISKDENKRKFIIKNNSNKKVNVVKVDNCLIVDGNKCDWLFEIDDKKVFYVELKGKDISKALLQLSSTIEFCKNYHQNFIKKVFVVSSRVPSSGTDIQKSKQNFIKKYKLIPNIKNHKIEEVV